MRTTRLAVAVIGLGLLAGCGGPAATPVEGTVAFAGGKKKANNLLLNFHPTAAEGTGGSAVTDEAGKFAATANDGRPGLPPGAYIVTVVDNNLSVEDEPGKGKRPPPNRVPPKYLATDEKMNPLKLTVEKGKTGYELKLD